MTNCTDCSDLDGSNFPGNTEQCDGQDNDCNGQVPAEEYDNDFDGYRVCEGDCDDGDASENPGQIDVCNDGNDQDCDGTPDNGPGCN